MLAFFALCFSLLLSAVLGSPLTQRDVFNPHITNPHEGTVWAVGSKETVTWETDNIPPDSQLTNPNGRVILGFMENDSLNLQLDHPLAENFKLRVGKVDITVPDVPPRDDYIIVLMGDSGNASPAFAITSIKGGTSTPPANATIHNSPPLIGTSITGSLSTPASSATLPESTPTAPSSLSSILSSSIMSSPMLSSASPTSNSVTGTAEAAAAATSTSAAWSLHNTKLWSVIAAPLALSFLL